MGNGSHVVAQGSDLVGTITKNTARAIDMVISCNPNLMGPAPGSRLARLSQLFSTYRPKRFVVKYVPICAATTAGIITMGTLWSDNTNEAETNCLLASNGGIQGQISQPWTSHVDLTKLPQRAFSCRSDHDIDSEPFVFVVKVENTANSTACGNIVVEWEYDLENPSISSLFEGEIIATNATTVAQTVAGPLELTLPSDSNFTSWVPYSIPSLLVGVLFVGMRYILKRSGADKYVVLDDVGSVVNTAEILIATVVGCNLGYVKSTAAPPVTVQVTSLAIAKQDFPNVVPPLEPTGTTSTNGSLPSYRALVRR
jgi:hypothetical protein